MVYETEILSFIIGILAGLGIATIVVLLVELMKYSHALKGRVSNEEKLWEA